MAPQKCVPETEPLLALLEMLVLADVVTLAKEDDWVVLPVAAGAETVVVVLAEAVVLAKWS